MEEKSDLGVRVSGNIKCPNCEEMFDEPGMPEGGKEFPCPKCAFLIPRRDLVQKAGGRIVAKMVVVAGEGASMILFSWIGVAIVLFIITLVVAISVSKFDPFDWKGLPRLKQVQATDSTRISK